MKELTSSVYTFEKLINGNFLYIDKTEYIWKLIRPASAMYFMSRPRRFGKSLTVSTLEAVFSGKKELFKDLALYHKDYDWKTYPIIHLDMGNCDAKTPEELESFIFDMIVGVANQFNIEVCGQSNSTRFEFLIQVLYKQGPVVILVDEYDKPILGNVTNPHIRGILDVLKGFYSTIKKCEPYERFVFLTGVSKFAHVSVFSDLNNLTDIAMTADYACMMGYTQSELETYFGDRIDRTVESLNITKDELLRKLKEWYNGYRFEESAASVYNPVSVAQFFMNGGKFNNYWFSTGTPSFLIELIKEKNFDLERALTQPVSNLAFEAFELDRLNPLSLLLQTGYLTIRDFFIQYDSTRYLLDFPNREVKEAFEERLLSYYTSFTTDDVKNICFDLIEAIKQRNIPCFMDLLKTFFARVPYDVTLNSESSFQLLFYSVFLLLGIRIEAESRTNNGRIDAVISDADCVFIFEFKINQDAEIALSQIREKEYFAKYRNSGKRIILIGANFNTEKRQLDDWKHEEVGKVQQIKR